MQRKIDKILNTVAKNNDVTINFVMLEIEKAIASASSNPDPKIKAFWCNFQNKNKKLSLEEFILYMGNMLLNQNCYSR